MAKAQFLERYRRLGHDLSGEEKTGLSIRANTLKMSCHVLLSKLENLGAKPEEIKWLREGLFIDPSEYPFGSSFEYLLGFYTPQEAASQFPVEVLEPKEDEIILDMCAAPGGKTTQISAWMSNRGSLVAVDINRNRLYALENNLERLGIENCIVYRGDASELDYGMQFDKILLDAPCSGNYVVDKGWFSRRTLKDVEANADKQRPLLSSAVRWLKEKGILIYTTCSLEPEENELNIQWLLNNFNVDLIEIKGPGNPGLTDVFGITLDSRVSHCRRFWPDYTGTQGFFVAKVIKL